MQIATTIHPHAPAATPVANRSVLNAHDGGAVDQVGIRKAAIAFEAMFVADMLKHSGLGKAPEEFGGGQGESAFASFLTRAYAEKIAESGSLGLSEAIVRAIASTEASNG